MKKQTKVERPALARCTNCDGQARRSVEVNIGWEVVATCMKCKGSGVGVGVCKRCRGSGKVYMDNGIIGPGSSDYCWDCRGTGKAHK